MIKALFLAYFFPPVGGAGVQRVLRFVRHLPAEGVLPIVVTGPGPTEDHWTPRDTTLAAGIPSEVPISSIAGLRLTWERRVPLPSGGFGTQPNWLVQPGLKQTLSLLRCHPSKLPR
jgi:hypothetical protein